MFIHLISFTPLGLITNNRKMEFKIDRNSTIPLHTQAENLLRELIKLDEYQKGKLLPSEVELSKKLKISRSTLRQAINKLVNEGLLVRKKGYGTKIAIKGISGRAKNWFSFSQEMAALGVKVQNFELHVSWEEPNHDVLSFFELKPGTRLLKLERLRGKVGLPFVHFISYFSPNIGLSSDNDFSQPLYEILEQKYNVKATVSYEEISAIKAPKYICDKLSISTEDPVLFRKRYVYDENKQPIEFNYGYYRGDSFVYAVESERK
jgi:GntR family transcriptional regulator